MGGKGHPDPPLAHTLQILTSASRQISEISAADWRNDCRWEGSATLEPRQELTNIWSELPLVITVGVISMKRVFVCFDHCLVIAGIGDACSITKEQNVFGVRRA